MDKQNINFEVDLITNFSYTNKDCWKIVKMDTNVIDIEHIQP
jgi:hypothetical protein